MERIQKTTGCKACQIRTGHLFETHEGGTYWDREGRRRHFQRTRSEDFSWARQALSWTAREGPAWSSSRGRGEGGMRRGSTSNPAPVFLAHSPCLSPGSPHAAHQPGPGGGRPGGPGALEAGGVQGAGLQVTLPLLPYSVPAARKAAGPGKQRFSIQYSFGSKFPRVSKASVPGIFLNKKTHDV